jgi:TrmH family RNA methyltransferase
LKLIKSRQNQIIKDILALRDKKNRRKERSFLIEGFRFVQEALYSKADIKLICVSSDSVEKFKNEFAPGGDINIIEVPPELFRIISQTETPQGILAVVGITDGMPELIYKKGFRVLFLDSVQEPGNAGTMIRTAHALGFDAVLTGPGTVDVFNSKALRATMGSIFNIPVLDNIHGNEMLEFCRKNRLRIIASRLEEAKPCYETNLEGDFLLVIGNEGKGVSDFIQKHATEFVYIPMPGGAESYNAAVAASIIMYESFRQRGKANYNPVVQPGE